MTFGELNEQREQPRYPTSNVDLLYDMYDEQEDPAEAERRKFNKGLKLLSVDVKDIVASRQSTTYKEVAEIILKDTIKYQRWSATSQKEIAREEQNIKRRVYDALNVLISAGILVKEGKKVRRNDVNRKIRINEKRNEMNSLRTRIVGL